MSAEGFRPLSSYACGPEKLIESRIHEHEEKRGAKPQAIVVHAATAAAIIETVLPPEARFLLEQREIPRERWSEAFAGGAVMGVPVYRCIAPNCQGPDLLIGCDGDRELL